MEVSLLRDLSVIVFAAQTHEEMEIEAWAYKPEPQSRQVQHAGLKDLESGHSKMCKKSHFIAWALPPVLRWGIKPGPREWHSLGTDLPSSIFSPWRPQITVDIQGCNCAISINFMPVLLLQCS